MKADALIATRKGLFFVGPGPHGFEIKSAAFEGDNVPMALWDRRDGAIYAVIGHGHFGSKLHRSRDDGATWTEIGVPVYPERPADADDVDPTRKTPIAWTLELVWALEAGGADEPGVLWAGTVPGGVFKSEDGGASWRLCRSLWDRPERRKWFGGGLDRPGVHSIVVDPRDSRHVIIAVSCGGVWNTRDGGDTWTLGGAGLHAAYMPPELAYEPYSQDVHRAEACAAAPDTLWAQHHNGIFRSTDGGTTFTEITTAAPSAFGFAVAAHPRDPATAWFVPAVKDERRIPTAGRLVVTRTRDGGATFDQLGRGLPDRWAYDLVFRHALAVDGEGRRLLMGSTTGNVWGSADAGDSWQPVANHLPPVYCVRFR